MMRPAVLGLALALPVQAADVSVSIDYSKEFARCMNEAAGVTPRMHDCLGTEFALWDARLNKAYQALLASDVASAHVKAELRDAQLAWIAYRDKACLAAGDMQAEGGTLAGIIASDCALSLTAMRANELEALLKP